MTARFLTRLMTWKCAFVEGSKLARGKKCKVTRAGWGRIRSGAVGKNADDIGEGVDARIMCVCAYQPCKRRVGDKKCGLFDLFPLYLLRFWIAGYKYQHCRCLLAVCHCPKVGDRTYNEFSQNLKTRLFLHCHRMELHDLDLQGLVVEEPLPQDLQDILEQMREKKRWLLPRQFLVNVVCLLHCCIGSGYVYSCIRICLLNQIC